MTGGNSVWTYPQRQPPSLPRCGTYSKLLDEQNRIVAPPSRSALVYLKYLLLIDRRLVRWSTNHIECKYN